MQITDCMAQSAFKSRTPWSRKSRSRKSRSRKSRSRVGLTARQVQVMGVLVAGLLASCGESATDPQMRQPELQPQGGPASTPSARQFPIVFLSDRAEAGVRDIYLMAPDGSGVTRLTRGGDFALPQWSPDGETIAVRRLLEEQSADVGLVSLDGSDPVLLTAGESPSVANRPVTWAPDGQRLAFASWREDEDMILWSVSRSGGQGQRLLPNLESDAVNWSRAGSPRVVYTQYQGTKNSDLWLADSLDSPAQNLTQGRVYAPAHPRWSPDGTRIALQGFPLLPDGTLERLADHSSGLGPTADIFVIDVDSGVLTRITDDPGNDIRPVWSPDGETLLIASDREGDGDIWLLPLAAPEQAINLTDDADVPAEDKDADWYWAP
jgi:Tol biopolymer transport system component